VTLRLEETPVELPANEAVKFIRQTQVYASRLCARRDWYFEKGVYKSTGPSDDQIPSHGALRQIRFRICSAITLRTEHPRS
jgi:hypothetical protein